MRTSHACADKEEVRMDEWRTRGHLRSARLEVSSIFSCWQGCSRGLRLTSWGHLTTRPLQTNKAGAKRHVGWGESAQLLASRNTCLGL